MAGSVLKGFETQLAVDALLSVAREKEGDEGREEEGKKEDEEEENVPRHLEIKSGQS